MPIYRLTRKIVFPPPDHAEPEGLLAVGGDLRSERILLAYASGIFPWYSNGEPILWWSPDPRFILLPGQLKVAKSLQRTLKKAPFRVTYDTDFRAVIEACRTVPRRDQDGTWITQEMLEAYCRLHSQGFAHSVEVWAGDTLAGGLYGLSLGSCFFGESMFARQPDASKIGFVTLVNDLRQAGCTLIDCQTPTDHLARFGAGPVPRTEFLALLNQALEKPTLQGKWRCPGLQDTPDRC